MKKYILFILFMSVLLTSCVTTKQQTRLILNDEYSKIVNREIKTAKKSIYIIAYRFLVYNYQVEKSPNEIFKNLIEAKKRGVNIYVLLDFPNPKYKNEEIKNQKAFNRLKAAGIDVRFDSAETTTHSKIIIIDAETVVLGSHNYSLSGLKYNNETSILFRDREKAKKLIEYFKQIKK